MNLLKVSKYSILLRLNDLVLMSVLAIFFSCLPLLELENTLNTLQIGKFIWFTAGMIICILTVIPHLKNLRLSLFDGIIGLLIIFISTNRYLIQTSYNFSLVYYEILGLSVLYFVLRQISLKKTLVLALMVITGGLIQCLYGQFQLFGLASSKHALFSITGSFFNPGPFAGYIASVFPLALGLFIICKKSVFLSVNRNTLLLSISSFSVICCVVILLVIPATQSRAAILGLLSGSLFLLVRIQGFCEFTDKIVNTKIVRKWSVSILFLLCLLFSVLVFAFKRDSASGRLLIWKIGSKIIAENPLTGVGADRFRSYYMDEQANYFKRNMIPAEVKVADNVAYAFNEPLQFIIENGLIGFLLLFSLLLLIFFFPGTSTNRKLNRHLLVIAQGGLLSIGIFSLFSYPSQILPIKINAVLYLGLISKVSFYPVTFITIISTLQKNAKLFVAIVVFVVSFLVSGYLNKLYNSFKEWDEALEIYNIGSYKESLPSYQNAYPTFNQEGSFLTNYGKALSMAGRHQEAVRVLKQAAQYQNNIITQTALGDSYKTIGDIKEAENAYLASWYMVPARLYPQYLLAKLYSESDQKGKAVNAALKVLRTPAKVESMAVEQMKAEMKKIVNED